MALLVFLLLLMVAMIVGLVWYIKHMLKKLLFISENINNLLFLLREIGGLLKSVYSLEIFYGEPVLENLLKHSKEIIENIKQFEDIYELTDNDSNQSEEEDEENK